MQAIDALLTRRSARALIDPAPDEAALALMFACATRAPDHGRLRPWRFVVVRSEARGRFGDLLADHLRRAHPQVSAETLERERLKAFRAPLIVVVAAHCNPTAKIPAIEQTLSAGAAAHAMMLAAFALGFNAMWKTGAPAYDPLVKSALGLESTDDIVGFLYLGTEPQRAPHVAGQWEDLVRDFAVTPAQAGAPAASAASAARGGPGAGSAPPVLPPLP
jgi:nitroreductase